MAKLSQKKLLDKDLKSWTYNYLDLINFHLNYFHCTKKVWYVTKIFTNSVNTIQTEEQQHAMQFMFKIDNSKTSRGTSKL